MREGRQNEGDASGQQTGKVVRLPRDWLGPREELVPFGHQPTPPAAEDPPSGADFWGEGSAAIHDALPVSDEDAIDAEPRSQAEDVWPPRRRRVALAAGLAIAAAAVAALAAVGFGLRTPSSGGAAGPRFDMAAVFNSGVSTLKRGVTSVGARASASRSHRATGPRPRAKVPRRTAHPRSVFKPVHESARRQPSAPVSYTTPASTDVAPPSSSTQSTSNAAGGGTSQTTITRTRHASSPATGRSSSPARAPVSATGESGALGPVHSPNG